MDPRTADYLPNTNTQVKMPKDSHCTRPIQTAKRKQKPLGQDELVMRKKSKTTKAATNEEDETANILDENEDSALFISPEKYLGKETTHDEPPKEFVSPLKYKSLADDSDERPRAKQKKPAKKRGDQEGNSKPQTHSKILGEKRSSTRVSDNVEKSNENPSDRFVRSAQEDLMQMIDEGAGDIVIENQLKIMKMLRARLPSQIDEPRNLCAPHKQAKREYKERPQPKAPSNDIPERPEPRAPRHPLSIASDSDSDSNLSALPTPSPGPSKRPKYTSNAKAETGSETEELLKTARPARAPTTLPATQRKNKSLSSKDVAKFSKTHPTFDEGETNRFDRHTRKMNSTRSMASDRPAMPERGLESRIRAPTSSPEVEPTRTSQNRLDAVALKALDSGTAAAGSFISHDHQPSRTACKSTPVAQPTGKGNLNANVSPRELDSSDRTMRASVKPQKIRPRRAVTLGGRPGQVWNEATKRWQFQYVEEEDSDDD